MNRYFRLLLIGVSAVQALLAIAFILQLPFVTRMWPLPYTNPTSYLFIGSIFAAAAASTLWCIFAQEPRALAGVALDYVTILIPLAILVFQIAARTRSDALTLFGVICALGAVFGLGLFLWSRRMPVRDTQPVPRPVFWSFVFFVVALIGAGGQMVLKIPNILPWSTPLDSQIVYGWMFLGAAAYFAYGLLRPGWYNAAGQLVGFLAYDLVLIGPFLARLSSITPEMLPNLLLYIFALSFSGLLAIYYLLIHPPTRVWKAHRALPVTASD